MEKELSGKVAIVTGAGRLRGIGRATAEELAKMGANIVVTGTGRNPDSFPEDEKEAGWKDIESTAEQIEENIQALLVDLKKAKPAAAKGVYLKKLTLSSTMGPGLNIDQASFEV